MISEFETGKILNCNSVFASAVNYSIEELIRKTAADLGIFRNAEQRRDIVAGRSVLYDILRYTYNRVDVGRFIYPSMRTWFLYTIAIVC